MSVPVHHHISGQWHSDQARNEPGGWPADADDDRFLNPGSEDNLSAGCVWTGSSGPFLGFEHWWEDTWGLVDNVGGGGISDVFNSDYQGGFPPELDTTTVSPTQLQTAYLSNANFGPHFQPTSSLFSTSLDAPGNMGSQASSDTVSGWPDHVTPIQGFGLELLLRSTAGENALTDLSNLPCFSANGQLSQLSAEDIRLAAQAMPKRASSESPRKASLNESSSGNATPRQIWVCDFQDCGRLCESHKKLK